MKKNNPLLFNLVTLFAVFYFLHNLYLFLVIILYKMGFIVLLQNCIASLVYDGAILTGLFLLLDKFVNEESGKVLQKINSANIISLFRITSLPVVFILLLYLKNYPILPVFLPYVFIIFLSDLIDGIIARKYHQITRIGKYIDASSDYLILIAISIIFMIYNLIPAWFFIVVMIRLLSYPLGMILISIINGHLAYDISLLGKISIFLVMSIYVFVLISLAKIELLQIIKSCLEYLVGFVLVVSLADKIISIIKTAKQIKKRE